MEAVVFAPWLNISPLGDVTITDEPPKRGPATHVVTHVDREHGIITIGTIGDEE